MADAITVEKGAIVEGPGEVGGGDTYGGLEPGPLYTSVAGVISGVTFGDSAGNQDSTLYVLSGGSAYGVKAIESGMVVEAGGTASGTMLSGEGADLNVEGSATGARVGSATFEFVRSGGVASDDIIQSSAALYLEGTGAVSRETVQSGGMVDFQNDLTSDFTLAVSGSAGIAPATTTLEGVTVSRGGSVVIGGATPGERRDGKPRGRFDHRRTDRRLWARPCWAPERWRTAPSTARSAAWRSGTTRSVTTTIRGFWRSRLAVTPRMCRCSVTARFSSTAARPPPTPCSKAATRGLPQPSSWISAPLSGRSWKAATQEIVEYGAVASGTAVSNGGVEIDYGSAVGTVVSSGGVASVLEATSAHGVESRATILAGGLLEIGSGGEGHATMLAGKEYVEEFSVASGTTVMSGGRSYDFALGSATATLLSSGGVQYVYGVASGTTVLAGGDESIESGGTGEAARLAGKEDVEAGGVASRTAISGGGVANVLGVADLTTVSNGGEEVVRGGVASGTTVLSGGVDFVLSGVAEATTISGGGRAAVKSGAETDATVDGGASLTVSAGGTVSGTLTLAGGTATVYGAVAAGATVAFSGSGGLLVLDDASAFEGDISGLADASQKIELAGFAYSTSETVSFTEAASNTSGVLTVHDGARTAALTLVGSYATIDFTLAKGPGGSTYIYDPPAASAVSGPAPLAQAVAAFAARASEAVHHPGGADGPTEWSQGRPATIFPAPAHALHVAGT